jgi:hypothetical protein
MNALRSPVTRFRMLVVAMAVLPVLFSARPALAGAVGTEAVPAFKLDASAGGKGVSVSAPITVPAGYLNHMIKGSGRKIESQRATYTVSPGIGGLKGQVCNWQIDFSYKENGKEYMRERGKPIRECGGIVHPVVGHAKPKTVRFGKACAELWVNGKFRAAQCHNIVR